MLYSEFLEGTGTTENIYNYSEYVRINAIYSNDPRMTKIEAYALYNKPDGIISDLLEINRNAAIKNSDLSWENMKLKKEIEELTEKLRSAESVKNSLQYTLDECLTEAKQAANRISNLIHG